jgi:purine-nucleoside phosphorylase
METINKIKESAAFISGLVPVTATTGLVLGTGMDGFLNSLENKVSIPYKDIPHFPESTVKSHSGKLIFGYIGTLPVWVMAGRFHTYEGYSGAEVGYPVRVLSMLGVDHLILTNAAGGINPHFDEGDIVVIEDHINLMPDHPLRGPNDDNLGLRFPDMMYAYDPVAIQNTLNIADRQGIRLKSGVYLGLQGPSLETPAEYRMGHRLGADMVGMSTIPEVIVARHCNIKVLAFSIISNTCFPKSRLSPTTLEAVINTVNNAGEQLHTVIRLYLQDYSKQIIA